MTDTEKLNALMNYIRDAERCHLDNASKGVVESGIKSMAIQDVLLYAERELGIGNALIETEDEESHEINIEEIAQCIAEALESCGFDNVQDSSGYYTIKEFENGTDRAVDVYKSTNDGNPHYVIYCSYEDEQFDYEFTDDLSVESLTQKLMELSS